jgi:hypothetical protein
MCNMDFDYDCKQFALKHVHRFIKQLICSAQEGGCLIATRKKQNQCCQLAEFSAA